MLRGLGCGPAARLSAVGAGSHGLPGRFCACAGRVTGVYGAGADELMAALCGQPSRRWRRRGTAEEVVPIAPVEASVSAVLSGVASQFAHRSPTRAAAAAAAAVELGDLRGRVVSRLSPCDRRCLALAAAALTGARFLVLPRADAGLAPREVVVLATATVRCASALGVGIVLGATATRNAFWADDVWHVGALRDPERVSVSACADKVRPGTVVGWVGGAGSG